MPKTIVLDMDGTLADLYGVPNWLPLIRSNNAYPFAVARPMWDMAELAKVLNDLRKEGWAVSIVTWFSKDAPAGCSFNETTRLMKQTWLAQHGVPYDHFHGVVYGTTKANCVRRYTNEAILIDDNAKVREGWSLGATVDPTSVNIIEYLKNLLTNE